MKRDCGDCCACCVYLRINTDQLVKPGCVHCPQLAVSNPIEPNVMQLSSEEPVKCKIYDRRPSVCAEYECLWLQGYGAEDDRPDKSLVLVDTLHRIDNGIECKPLAPNGENDLRVMQTIRRMMHDTGKAAIVTSFYERSIVRVVTE